MSMTHQSESSEQTINITMLAHVDGQLFMAVSDDLPGLSVVGLSPEEIESKIEPAIRDFLEMSGYEVVSIQLVRDARLSRAQFGLPAFAAHASLMSS
jgi:hypothetical protein